MFTNFAVYLSEFSNEYRGMILLGSKIDVEKNTFDFRCDDKGTVILSVCGLVRHIVQCVKSAKLMMLKIDRIIIP